MYRPRADYSLRNKITQGAGQRAATKDINQYKVFDFRDRMMVVMNMITLTG